MANILSLAARINADASGFKLDPVQKALRSLGDETAKVAGIFDKFTDTSEAAAKAQADTSKALQDLIAARREGALSAEEFAKAFERIRDAATQEAAALQRAADITQANLTPLERYDQSLAELKEQLDAGRISQETFTRANERAAKGLNDAERAARGFEVATEATADNAAKTTLQFNELSGVFSILPGPLGNIAGRISGIASAGEGLSRVFAGGLRQGITNVASSFTGLLTNTNLALGGIAAFGAAAVAITRGLVDLEARVKSLGASADRLGVSFQTIQVLEEAAARAGTSIEAASAGLQKFAARVDDARSGTGAAAEAFRELGISQEELANTAPTELAARVAEELGKIEDPARRAALQVDLLGKSGEELRRTFSEIPGAADDLEKFGAAISPEDRARIEALGPAFDGFGVALRGLGQSVITPFAGIVAGLTETLGSLINVVTAVAQAIGFVLKPVLDGVGAAFGLFADGINNTVGFFRSFFASTDEAAEKVETLKAAAEEATEFDDAAAKAFQKTLEGVQKTLSDAVDESAQFGQAGFDAALQYQNSITELQRQFDQGIINEESFKRAAEQANEAYEQQIDTIRRATEETERKAQAEADAVQSIIDANLEQIRVDQQFGGDSSRARAADNLLKLQQEQLRVEEQLQAARAAGDADAINALSGRLATLDQVAARERDIASGAAKQREAAAKAAEDAAKEAERVAQQRTRDLERVNEQILNRQAEFSARQFEIELERAQEIATVRTGAIEINDIREGGISAFFDTLKEDPAIAEAKKTNKELEQIRKGIAALQAERVDILAGTG